MITIPRVAAKPLDIWSRKWGPQGIMDEGHTAVMALGHPRHFSGSRDRSLPISGRKSLNKNLLAALIALPVIILTSKPIPLRQQRIKSPAFAFARQRSIR